MEEGCRHFMQGYQRCQGSERQQDVEEYGNDDSHQRHRCKGFLEDVGKGDEDEGGAGVGVDADREGSGENHQSGKNGDERVDGDNVARRLEKVGLTGEIAGKGADAAHADAERIKRLAHRGEEHGGIHV